MKKNEPTRCESDRSSLQRKVMVDILCTRPVYKGSLCGPAAGLAIWLQLRANGLLAYSSYCSCISILSHFSLRKNGVVRRTHLLREREDKWNFLFRFFLFVRWLVWLRNSFKKNSVSRRIRLWRESESASNVFFCSRATLFTSDPYWHPPHFWTMIAMRLALIAFTLIAASTGTKHDWVRNR